MAQQRTGHQKCPPGAICDSTKATASPHMPIMPVNSALHKVALTSQLSALTHLSGARGFGNRRTGRRTSDRRQAA